MLVPFTQPPAPHNHPQTPVLTTHLPARVGGLLKTCVRLRGAGSGDSLSMQEHCHSRTQEASDRERVGSWLLLAGDTR